MRAFILFLIMLLAVPFAVAQNYKPKPGETVMKIEIEGRGNVFVRLLTDAAPKTTTHIQRLVKNNFYDGQRFHRVEKSPRPYLVQVGDPASKNDVNSAGQGGSGARIPYENSGVTHGEGAVGLARSGDDPNSGDSQFYITLAPARFLDGKYTVFGEVVAGMDVVKKVEKGDRVVAVTILSGS